MNNQGDFITMPDNHLPESQFMIMLGKHQKHFTTLGYKSWVKGDPLDIQIKKQLETFQRLLVWVIIYSILAPR